MAQWYVKDLSKLTRVSVQTLHHYDRIDLLKPSVRLSNGYRVYSEKDLLKLQQIIALKFFDFELAQIKMLLAEENNVLDHFISQAQFLEEKAKLIFDASKALNNIIADCNRDKSIPWQTIIKLIEVYHMTQQLQKTWAGKVFNQEELNQYVDFEQNIKSKYSKNELEAIQNHWHVIIEEVEANLAKDPTTPYGIELGKRTMEWVNSFYGKDHITLRNAIWEKGLKAGHIEDHPLSPKGVAWLDKAIDAYYRERLMALFNQIDKKSDKELVKEWNELLLDMYGNNQSLKDKFYDEVMKDTDINITVKNWIKRIR